MRHGPRHRAASNWTNTAPAVFTQQFLLFTITFVEVGLVRHPRCPRRPPGGGLERLRLGGGRNQILDLGLDDFEGTIVQTKSVSDPNNEYAAPDDGVLTQWSKFAPATSTQLKLKVARQAAEGKWQVVGESPLETLTRRSARATRSRRGSREGAAT